MRGRSPAGTPRASRIRLWISASVTRSSSLSSSLPSSPSSSSHSSSPSPPPAPDILPVIMPVNKLVDGLDPPVRAMSPCETERRHVNNVVQPLLTGMSDCLCLSVTRL